MLQECWVDGMPVYYSPTGWYGVAKGKTDDGKFIFEASYGTTYYVKNTDVFEVHNSDYNNSIGAAFEEMKSTICPYRRIINDYFDDNLSFDEAYKEIANVKIPDGIKPEAPVVEYFNKYRETFLKFVDAYSKKYENEKQLIKNVCGDNLAEVGQSKWGNAYVRRQGKKILKDAGVNDDIINNIPATVLGVACRTDLTFGEIKVFDGNDEANAFVREATKNGLAQLKYRVNGFYLCCSYIEITRPNDYAF